jgi:hypothetical protein
MAQMMAHDTQKKGKAHSQKELEKKRERRKEYEIGWNASRIPRNDAPASKLALRDVKQGMVCLVFQEDSNSVRVASTGDPAAALNLEYLSTALQVRRKEGHEPIFSLDPTDPNDMYTMQSKVFIPDWLAGTSAGDVLFEADYHLKELSMGEYEQPVIGMKSCFDHSMEKCFNEEWKAREWFTVRKAEVQMSDDSNMLIPYVKMGVEAREQVLNSNGLQDAPITRPGHPMVKYAESFTHNFDLIAERKSVIYHLRELAKASVIAKYLLDAAVNLEEEWFELPIVKDSPYSLEVPQLWNERFNFELELKDGKLTHEGKVICKGEQDTGTYKHSVYGGVKFGLDRFKLSTGLERQANTGLENLGIDALGAPIMRNRLPAQQRLQGVDLRLDQFDLTVPKRVPLEAPLGSWGENTASLDACVAVADSFWSSITEGSKVFGDEDARLLRTIFSSEMSDRKIEGDLFSPPDASYSYVTKLRELVKEEEEVRQGRKDHFLSAHFQLDSPGRLFPRSWALSSETSKIQDRIPHSSLQERHDLDAQDLNYVCRSAAPLFEKSTEEGRVFRIYRLGSLEVRTTQEPNGQEVVGAAFSIRAPVSSSDLPAGQNVTDGQMIRKATEYVEILRGTEDRQCQYYVMLETTKGEKILTELTCTGRITWQENPKDVDDRNSLAKVTRSAECAAGVSILDLKNFQAGAAQSLSSMASQSMRKQYAQSVFNVARHRALPTNKSGVLVSPYGVKMNTFSVGHKSSMTGLDRTARRSAAMRLPLR